MNTKDSLQRLKMRDKNWVCCTADKLEIDFVAWNRETSLSDEAEKFPSVMPCSHKGSHSFFKRARPHCVSWLNARGLFLLTNYEWIVRDHRSLHVWDLLCVAWIFFFLNVDYYNPVVVISQWLNSLPSAVEHVPLDVSESVSLIDWAIKSLSVGLTGLK